jgi:hypothetical protein
METQSKHPGLRLVSEFECPAGETTVLPRPDPRSNQRRSVSLIIEDGFTIGRVLFVGTEVFVFIGNRKVTLYSEVTISLNPSGAVEVNNQHHEAIDYSYRKPSATEMNSAQKVGTLENGYAPELITQRVAEAQQRVHKLTALALGSAALLAVGTGFVYRHAEEIGDFAEAMIEKTAQMELAFLPPQYSRF